MTKLPKGFAIEETVDGRFLVLCEGIQWGKGPRDASGCSSQTWDTYGDALREIARQERAQ